MDVLNATDTPVTNQTLHFKWQKRFGVNVWAAKINDNTELSVRHNLDHATYRLIQFINGKEEKLLNKTVAVRTITEAKRIAEDATLKYLESHKTSDTWSGDDDENAEKSLKQYSTNELIAELNRRKNT